MALKQPIDYAWRNHAPGAVMGGSPRRMNATKANWAGGVSGAVTAALMLGAHFAGVITLGPDAIMAALASIGAGVSVGVVSWLGTYRAPANQPR